MEPKFRTSFIPKQPVAAAAPRKASRGASGLVFLLALIIFLASVALAAGVFLYREYLEQSIASKSEQLERAREAFEPALIQELTRLDSRLSTANALLRSHISVTAIFDLLEENTLEGVRFTDFRYSVGSGDSITLSMNGQATSYGAVALQSDAFGRTRFLRDPIFSDVNLDQEGLVSFKFNTFIDSSLINFERTLAGRSGEATPPSTSSTTTTP